MKLSKATLPLLLAVSAFIGCQRTPHIEDLAIPKHNCTSPQPRHRWDWWTERHEQFNKIAAKGDVDLVFLGDSIIDEWKDAGKEVWAKYYGKRKAANFGMSGDCTQHVIWRIDNGNLDGISPKLIVVMIGTNNSGYDSAQQIADGVTAIVQRLRVKLPKTKILVLGIFPRGENADDPNRARACAANTIFKNIADGRMVHYMDIGDKFTNDNGTISTEIMYDLVHPTPRGYEIWADAIEAKVAELMGERR